jgi:tRNA(Ile)-lysidine synthase
MNLHEKFSGYINEHSAAKKALKFLLAVSGGVDSVVLCDLFDKAGLDFIIAHCNFQLRGEESDRDELFVKHLGERYGKEVFVKRFETYTYASDNKVSTQVAARDLRYKWFRTLAFDEKKADLIVTAHHADDNIETVVMNFFRGTGLKGLIGMDAEYLKIFRPLLPFRKREIVEYAEQNNLKFVEDSSNASNKYTRNYFRNELLPAVQKVFPQAEENILKNIERLREVEQVYEQAIKQQKQRLIELKGNEEHIPILKLIKTPSYRILLWEIIKERNFTAGQLDEVIKLFNSDNGSYIDSQFYRIIKNRKWIIITPHNTSEVSNHFIIDEGTKKIKFNNQQLIFEIIDAPHFQISTSKNVACLDSKELEYPLLLRKSRQGDYFYPLGMRKKKKLSRFLIDQKLSKTEKENVWVIESNKKIIWVVGHRIDDRFKIEPRTTEVFKISLMF